MKLHQIKLGNEKDPPLIFFHGLFGQGDDFLEIAEKLSENYFCILVDLPSHGHSEVFHGNTFSDLCQFIFDSLGPFKSRPSLIGYSLGGRIALYFATHFPNSFEKVVIISANPGLESGKENRLAEDLTLLDNFSSNKAFFNSWYAKPLFGDLIKHKDFPTLLKKRNKINLEKIRKSLSSFSVGSQPSLWNKLEENSIPILYLCGFLDKKYLKIGRRLEIFPHIKLKIIQNASHNLLFENQTDCFGYLKSFLDNSSQV